MIVLIWAIVLLVICSYSDIKSRNISIIICAANILIAIGFHLVRKDMSIVNISIGIGIGVILLIASIVFKNNIGMGDGLVLLTIGIIEGGMITISVLIWTLIGFNIFAVTGLSLKKFHIKTELPLVPFMLLGNIVVAVMSGGKI